MKSLEERIKAILQKYNDDIELDDFCVHSENCEVYGYFNVDEALKEIMDEIMEN